MASANTKSVANRAKSLYETELRSILESEHRDRFVAIEPDSGEYFLGDTYGDAVMSARAAHPDRISFVIRVGHSAAIHIGVVDN